VEISKIQRGAFSEKEFYLAEFRGRAMGLALAPGLTADAIASLEPVLADLADNGTQTVLIGSSARELEAVCNKALVDASDPRWVGALWHALRATDRVGLYANSPDGLAACARTAALRLRLAKLVWLDPRGGLERSGGGRLSYVDRGELEQTISSVPERAGLLSEIGAMLDGGLPSAAICEPESLASELFTYAGVGTFFTRERYIEVRSLGLDEFERAHDLIRRGVEEGFLVPRTDDQLEEVLTNAFGVFVERRYLAGIGALIPHPAARAGELGSLYTLTRFAGEGVGGHLVSHACQSALEQGFEYIYACTTQSRVVRFFGDHGFAVVPPDAIPAEKWSNYPPERRRDVICLRRDVARGDR
jgi:N-acetylglutamate synthase-like GNAT family acetyltransferase